MYPINSPYALYNDLLGQPLSSGYLYFGVTGDNPETNPITVYWDSAATQPASQPIRTINGSPARNGAPAQLFVAGSYSLTIRDSNRALVSYLSNSNNIIASSLWTEGFAATWTTTTSFTIAGTDVTSYFPTGIPVKLTGGADRYAYVTSSVYGTDTVVTVDRIFDSNGKDATLHASMTTAYYPSEIKTELATMQTQTLAQAKNLTGTYFQNLHVDGRSDKTDRYQGDFYWNGGNLTSQVSGDTLNAMYIPPNTDSSGGSGAWVRIRENSQYNAGWFGAVCNGTTNDTTPVQACINYLGSAGGDMLIPASTYTDALTFPTPTKWLTVNFFGTWTTSATIPVISNVCLNGLGGYNGVQFATSGPVACIIADGVVNPVVEITGATRHAIKNFAIPSVTNVGIKFNGYSSLGALAWMDNVHVSTANVSTSEIPLQIESFFWIWAKNCVFLPYVNSGPSILITQTSGRAAGSYPGLLYFTDCIINSQGIHHECTQASASVSSEIHFDGLTYENCTEPTFIIDTSTVNNTVSNVTFSKVTIADSLSGYTCFCDFTGNFGTFRSLKIEKTLMIPGKPVVIGNDILGLHIDTTPVIDYTTGIVIGQQDQTANRIFDMYFGRIANRGSLMAPELVPYTTLNIRQDLSLHYAPPNLTVTGGFMAPDTTATAFLFQSSSGNQFSQENVAGLTVTNDDWVIAGVWVKSYEAGATPFITSYVQIPVPAGVTFQDSGNALLYLNTRNRHIYRPDTEWFPLVTHDKVTSNGGGGAGTFTFRFSLGASTTNSALYWKPWAMIIPASYGLAEEDVIRLKQVLVNQRANVVSGGDIVAMHDHHRLMLGGTGALIYSGTAAPATGTWTKGAFVHNTNPSVDGNSMIILGWICTVAGSPGTWQVCYASNVSPAV